MTVFAAYAQLDTLPVGSPIINEPLILSPPPSLPVDEPDARDLEVQIPAAPVAYEEVPMAFLLDFLGMVRVVALIALAILFFYLLYFLFCFFRRLRHEKAEAEAQNNQSSPTEGEELIKMGSPPPSGPDAAELSAVIHEQHRHLQEKTVVKEILEQSPTETADNPSPKSDSVKPDPNAPIPPGGLT